MRVIRAHYDVFSREPLDVPEVDIDGLKAEIERFDRVSRPEAFRTPRYALDQQGGPFSMPVTDGVGLSMIEQLLPQTHSGTSIRIDREWEDLSPFQLALGLAGAMGSRGGAVIVDRTADIGYTADEIIRLARQLNEAGVHHVREAVAVEESVRRGVLVQRSRGMAKYGQRDFQVEGFPPEHAEAGRRYLYDNLCQYAGLQVPIMPGQTMQYQRSDPGAKVIFTELPDGVLLVSDCHPENKEAIEGIAKLLSVFMPAYSAVLEAQAEAEDQEDEERG